MTADIERQVAQRLASGPLYVRSFHAIKPVIDRMVQSGLLCRRASANSAATNMVALTDAGRTRYLRGDKYAIARAQRAAERNRRVDQFAELLAEGYSASAAARLLGLSQQSGSKYFRQIREELGWQAQ